MADTGGTRRAAAADVAPSLFRWRWSAQIGRRMKLQGRVVSFFLERGAGQHSKFVAQKIGFITAALIHGRRATQCDAHSRRIRFRAAALLIRQPTDPPQQTIIGRRQTFCW